MIETGVVIGPNDAPIFWHLPPGRSGGALPDSRDLWDVLWEHRETVVGFAHTHPFHGAPWPSSTDVTTFAAIEAALGRRLSWWILTLDQIGVYRWVDGAAPQYWLTPVTTYPAWAARLRELSDPEAVERERRMTDLRARFERFGCAAPLALQLASACLGDDPDYAGELIEPLLEAAEAQRSQIVEQVTVISNLVKCLMRTF